MKNRKMKFERIYFKNRWSQPKYQRNSNWTVFGVSVWWAGWDSMCYVIGFFGLEWRIWFKDTSN